MRQRSSAEFVLFAAAARLDDSLVDRAEELHVIPSSYGIEAALNYSGTKILMKSASGISEVKRTLEEKRRKCECKDDRKLWNARGADL